MSNEFETFKSLVDSSERLENLSRRSLLAGGLAVGLVTADMALTDHLQAERSRVQIAEVSDDETREKFPHSAWLVVPGFKMGWDDSRAIAEKLTPSMSERGRVAYMGYSNQGLNLNEIKYNLDAFVEKEDIHELYLYGHSFGGMVALELASHMQKNTDIDCSTLLQDSSPSSREDVKARAELNTLTLLNTLNIPIPTCGRAVFELGERTVNKHERTFSDIYHQTVEQLRPGAPSSRLIRTEAAYIQHFDAREFSLRPNTNVAMLANMADETINISSATHHWSDLLKDAFKEVLWTNGARPAHASPFWNQGIYNQKILTAQQTLLPLYTKRYTNYY